MARRDDDDDDDRDDAEEDDDDRPRKKKSRGAPTNEEKQMAMFCHLGTLIGGFVIPLIIWMTKKEESRFIEKHGAEALNFAISITIWYMVLAIVTCGLGVFVLLPFVIWWTIAAGMAANKGEMYTYPLTIRFVK